MCLWFVEKSHLFTNFTRCEKEKEEKTVIGEVREEKKFRKEVKKVKKRNLKKSNKKRG
jgi:putative NIF3 family GTP cyclohydrolase 1 type 2